MNNQRIEEICTEIEKLTDEGNEELDLKGIDADEAKELLLALADSVGNFIMVLHNALCRAELKPPLSKDTRRTIDDLKRLAGLEG